MDAHKLYDVWEESNPVDPRLPWRGQLVDRAAHFATKAQAEKYINAVRDYRKANGYKT
jgi:N-acetyl-beta-hexosaminidase